MKPVYIFRGKVKRGNKRGHKLGFPTANIALHKQISEGVYASHVIVGGHRYEAATFIGSAKTFGETQYQAESYILDFNETIYDLWITIVLYQKLRGNIKFHSEKALITQMEEDVVRTREILGNGK